MGTVNHASSDLLLLLIVLFFSLALAHFGHLLEVEEAAVGVCMCLRLHHGQRLFVLDALTVHWAGPDALQLLVLLCLEMVVHLLLVVEVHAVVVLSIIGVVNVLF